MKIALYKGTSLISRIIRYLTRSPYSHAAVQLNDGTVIEAWTGTGVCHVAGLETNHKDNTEVEIFEVVTTPEQDKVIEAFLKNQVGKGYDYKGFLGFYLPVKQSNSRWFCSELVFAAFREAGILLLERMGSKWVSPALLATSCKLKFIKTIWTSK